MELLLPSLRITDTARHFIMWWRGAWPSRWAGSSAWWPATFCFSFIGQGNAVHRPLSGQNPVSRS